MFFVYFPFNYNDKQMFTMFIKIKQAFKMRKYGNISQYLANNNSLLSQNTHNQRNYDGMPTIRRGQHQRTMNEGTPSSQNNAQNLRRSHTNAGMLYVNTKRNWNQFHQQNSPYSNEIQSQDAKSRKNQRAINQRFRKQERQSVYPQRQKETLNLPEWQNSMKTSISKLKEIKQNLQNQIKLMQRILDDTSKSIEDMQKEFENIKYRILDYTSKCLDNAFINYRRKMPRWSKYEEVEKKGLILLDEISEYINAQADKIEKVSTQVLQVNFTASLKQVSNRITHYKSMCQQIRKVKSQCIQSHPTLKQDKIRQFQTSLLALCAF